MLNYLDKTHRPGLEPNHRLGLQLVLIAAAVSAASLPVAPFTGTPCCSKWPKGIPRPRGPT